VNLADIVHAMRTHECVDFHDFWTEVPKLARHARLAAAARLDIGLVGVAKLLPEPSSCAGENARGVRAEFFSREPVAGTRTILGHPDRNIDPGAIERTYECVGNISVERDRLLVAVKEHGDPALAEPVEAERPHPRFNSLKKSLPLSSMMMKAGKSSTSMRQIASMPSSGYSTTSTFLMQCSARFAAAPPIEPR